MHEAGLLAAAVAEALAAGGPSTDTGSGTPGALPVACVMCGAAHEVFPDKGGHQVEAVMTWATA
jgi:hypothetical protein